MLDLDARWLDDPERISSDCVTLGDGVPVIRRALDDFKAQLEERVNERRDPVTGDIPNEVRRAEAEGLARYRETMAIVDAHAELRMETTWLKPDTIGRIWVCLKDGDTEVPRALEEFKRRLDGRIEALKEAGADLDSPGLAHACATCERLYRLATSALDAQRTLGIQAPWIAGAYQRDLRCATLEGIADIRERLAGFMEQVEVAAQGHKMPGGVIFALSMERAVDACKTLHREAIRVAEEHERDIREASMSDALQVEDIPPPPPGLPPPVIDFNTSFAAAHPVYVMDDDTAEKWAGRTMKDLQRLYQPRPGELMFKSTNKANLRQGLDVVLERLNSTRGFRRVIQGSPDDLMAAARRMPMMNCVELVWSGQGYLKNQKPPIASVFINLQLPGHLSHMSGVLNAAHHLPLDKDMTRWPPDVWVFDRWSGKRAVRARDYPQHFLNQMRRWHANEQKFIRGERQSIEGIEFFRWHRPLDKRWVEGVINALRNLPTVPPFPSDDLQPWPGTADEGDADTGSIRSAKASARAATPDAAMESQVPPSSRPGSS